MIGLPLPQLISCSADAVRVGFALDDGANFEVWHRPGRLSCVAPSTEGFGMLELSVIVSACFYLLACLGQGMWEEEIAVVLLP